MTTGYSPGDCNIGPAEIARRRRIGHAGVAATAALLTLLLMIDAAPGWRLLIALPAGMAVAGYIQASLRFCANFGMRGIHNFGELGSADAVAGRSDRERDRNRAVVIGLASLGLGLVVALLSMLV